MRRSITMFGLSRLALIAPRYEPAAVSLMPAFFHIARSVNCERRYGLKPLAPIVTSTFDCAGWLMYDRNAYAASFTFGFAFALTPPDQPPNAANGAWFTPSTAYGQVALSQATSLPLSRSSTF